MGISPRKHRRQRRHILRSPGLWVVAITLVGGLGLVAIGSWSTTQLRPIADRAEALIVEVKRGQGASAVARELERVGVIRSAPAFEIYLAWSGLGRKLQAGYYELSPAMSGAQIARRIASGEVARRKLTIPEGLRLTQIAQRVGESGLATPEQFRAAAVPATVAGKVSFTPEGETLEGYLLPETYEFAYGTPAEGLVSRMVQEMDNQFVKPNAAAIAASPLSLHQIITLASLVEREAKVAEDRPKIAGVLRNRLARGMKLQCDATVQYALGQHKPRLTFRDLRVPSPYNTYLHAGLPPGPIASPGLDSLRAALHPARTDALFYVARPNGSHVFSRTYEEHLAAIARIRGAQRKSDAGTAGPG